MPQIAANGLQLEYESFGRKDDPVIILIMGFSGQLTMWPESLCEGLARRGYRVIRFDNRDVGKSTHLTHLPAPDPMVTFGKVMMGQEVDVPYRLEDMAADVIGLMDGLNIPAAHIYGASMGGMIAQILAIHYPTRVRSVISMMSTTGRPGLPAGKPEAMAVLTTPPASDSREDRIKQGKLIWRIIGSPAYQLSDEELEIEITRELDRVPFEPTGPARQLNALIAAVPRHETLGKVRCPALIIHGADDPLIPVDCGKDTAECIPGAQLLVIEGMGHDFAAGLVPRFVTSVGDFLDCVEGDRRKA